MRTITKSNSPPPCLAQQPQNQTWNVFMQTPCHALVGDALRQEQLHVCCYCEREINTTNSHVEHLIPRCINQLLAYSYPNLAASCNGDTDKNRHCGHNKGGQYDTNQFSAPHAAVTTRLFRYLNDGHVEPAPNLSVVDQVKAKHMIELLNLNCPRLTNSRRNHARSLVNTLGMNPTADIRNWATAYYLQPNANGHLREFNTLSRTILDR